MSEQHAQGADAVVDLNNELKTRREKLANLREQGIAFPNDFRRDHTSDQLHAEFDGKENEELEALNIEVAVAGRMMTRRIMGKASFVTLQDVGGRIQLYVARDDLPEGVYNEQFKKWDLGDILGAKGKLFKTKTGELSIHCTELRLLTKALRPLPDKFHGLQDQEARYRQRYLDLISNDESRNTFKVRSQILSGIRQFMVNRGFMEVETPMMQVILVVPLRVRLSLTITRWISTCTCVSRRNCTSSVWWSVASSVYSKSTVTSVTKVFPYVITQSSP